MGVEATAEAEEVGAAAVAEAEEAGGAAEAADADKTGSTFGSLHTFSNFLFYKYEKSLPELCYSSETSGFLSPGGRFP